MIPCQEITGGSVTCDTFTPSNTNLGSFSWPRPLYSYGNTRIVRFAGQKSISLLVSLVYAALP